MTKKDEYKELFEFYLANLKEIAQKDGPSARTIELFEDLNGKVEKKVSTDLFNKAVAGSLSLALGVGLAIIGANWKVMTYSLELYQKNFVTSREFTEALNLVKLEVESLRHDFEFAKYPE